MALSELYTEVREKLPVVFTIEIKIPSRCFAETYGNFVRAQGSCRDVQEVGT